MPYSKSTPKAAPNIRPWVSWTRPRATLPALPPRTVSRSPLAATAASRTRRHSWPRSTLVRLDSGHSLLCRRR